MTLRAYVNALLLVRSIVCGTDTTCAWLDRRLVSAAPVNPLEENRQSRQVLSDKLVLRVKGERDESSPIQPRARLP